MPLTNALTFRKKMPKIFDYKNIDEVDLINCPVVLYDDYKLLQEKIRKIKLEKVKKQVIKDLKNLPNGWKLDKDSIKINGVCYNLSLIKNKKLRLEILGYMLKYMIIENEKN